MSQKSSEEWESSVEGIGDSLSRFGDVVRGDNHTVMICKVLQQLPKSVRKKVLEEVHFIIVGKALYGTVFQMNILPSEKETILYFIILNFGIMVNLTEKEIIFTIAHEIAHHILGHHSVGGGPDAEKKADALAEKWGFKKTNDHGSWIFEERRKVLKRLVSDIEKLSQAPPLRARILAIEMNFLLLQLATLVEFGNEIMEVTTKDIYSLRAIIGSLVDELRKVKGLETQLEGIRKRLASVETTSSEYKDIYENLRKYLDKVRKAQDKQKKNRDYID